MTDLQQNKKVVKDFIELVFNQHRVDEGAERCLGDYYIQHNPNVKDGLHAFIENFKETFSTYPESHFEIKRMLSEGDLVSVHAHWVFTPGERGHAVMDIFRLENGKIVEHWDVIQDVPEQLAHSNTMF